MVISDLERCGSCLSIDFSFFFFFFGDGQFIFVPLVLCRRLALLAVFWSVAGVKVDSGEYLVTLGKDSRVSESWKKTSTI